MPDSRAGASGTRGQQDHDGSWCSGGPGVASTGGEQVAAVGDKLGARGVRRVVWGSAEDQPHGLVDVGQTA